MKILTPRGNARKAFCVFLLITCTGYSIAGSTEDEVEGVLIDRTVSIVGYKFYRELGDFRRANDVRATDNLIVYERPSARWGSLIWVVSGNDELYRNFIGPRLSAVPDIARQASPIIDSRLTRLKLTRILSDKFDLGIDEF